MTPEHILALPFTNEKGLARVSGIAKSRFGRKELGDHAVNPSLNCEAKCLYCSSHCVLGRLHIYQEHVGDWWQCKTFLYYTNVVEAVGRDAAKLDGKDLEVVVSSVVDPYQSRLVRQGVPRAILERLAPTNLRLRLLTKMTGVACDLPYVAETFGGRATVGTSIPILNPEISRLIEPFASPVAARQKHILGTAKQIGLRRYIMGCPIIPGSYIGYKEFAERWAKVADDYEPEKIWFEPLNGRGKNLDVLEQGLRDTGLNTIASRVAEIRNKKGWTNYVSELLGWVQQFAQERFDTRRVRFLLYPHMLTEEGRQHVEAKDETVIWL